MRFIIAPTGHRLLTLYQLLSLDNVARTGDIKFISVHAYTEQNYDDLQQYILAQQTCQ